MATTLIPTLTLASTDISASESLNLSVTDSLALSAGSYVKQSQVVLGNRLHTDLAAAAEYGKSYVYLKNLSTTTAEIVTVTLGAFNDTTVDYNNDPTMTMDVTGNIKIGMNVYHSVEVDNIPIGATVASVTNATTFELSASTADGNQSNQTLTFASPVMTLGPEEFAFFPWTGALPLGAHSASGTPVLEVRIFEA